MANRVLVSFLLRFSYELVWHLGTVTGTPVLRSCSPPTRSISGSIMLRLLHLVMETAFFFPTVVVIKTPCAAQVYTY
jgi:hypothetical protein